MNRRDLLQKLGGAIAVAGVVAVTTKEKALAQDGNCAPPEHYTNTFTSIFFSQCSQQYIIATVTYKTRLQTCTNADGSVTYKFHEQSHGTGQGYNLHTGQPTGTQYVLNDQEHVREINQPYNGTCTPSSYTAQYHELLISKGSAPNEQIVVTETFSLDSSCHPHFSFNADTDCHG